MSDKEDIEMINFNPKHGMIVSLPMYAKYMNKTFTEIQFNKLIVKMKSGTTDLD